MLVLAAIIYWQTREIQRAIEETGEEEPGGLRPRPALPRQPGLWWENMILYGEYVLRPTGGRCAGSGASGSCAREKFHSNANRTDVQPPFSPMVFAR
jgi:hypothetical protein